MVKAFLNADSRCIMPKPPSSAAPTSNNPPPDLQIAYVDPKTLLESAKRRAAKVHSPEKVAALSAVLREVGTIDPIMLGTDGVVLAGRATVLAAIDAGFDRIPVIDVSHLTEAQQRTFALAHNALAARAGYDTEFLHDELKWLESVGVDLALTGFEAEQLAELLAVKTEGNTDPDAAPPLPEAPASVRGDVWILGNHRLVCGDSTDANVVAAALNGTAPMLMVTDPPYGVNYDPNWRNEADRADGKKVGDRAVGRVQNDDRADWSEVWRLFPGTVAYVWHGGLHGSEVDASLRSAGFKMRAQIVWVKTLHVLSRGDYHWQHEPAYYAVKDGQDDQWRFEPEHEVADYVVKEGRAGNWKGDRKQSTVWFIEHLKSDSGHETQKPVECMRRPIINNSSPGQAVFEPFSGSGTTIIACEMTGRQCCAIELDPAYVDVAVKRWQAFTGKQAVHASDGRTFAAYEAERKPTLDGMKS